MDIKLQTNNLRAQMTLLIKHFIVNKFSAAPYILPMHVESLAKILAMCKETCTPLIIVNYRPF